nr:MAG TPA: AAA domain protein [Caudoviricetes sp.]
MVRNKSLNQQGNEGTCKGVTRCGKSLLCEVQILTSLFPVISHRIVQRMARKI